MFSSVLWTNKSTQREHKLPTDKESQDWQAQIEIKSSIFRFLQLVFYKILPSIAMNLTW